MLDRASGMLLIPVGCLCSALGLLLMKGAADDRPDLPPWRNPRWLFGFALLGVLATVVEVLVLGVLPLSVVAPFAGLTIVFSLLIASSGALAVPAERLSRADTACIALVLLGVTLVSAFGPHDSGALTLPALLAAYTRARFAGFVAVGVTGAAIVLCPCAALAASALLPVISAFAAASCACLSQLMLKLVSTSVATLPASLGPLSLALVGLICSAPLHLTLLNRTLAGSAVTIAVPCYQFLLIVCTTAAGGLLFDEFDSQSRGSLLAYGCGVVTATAGLLGLSYFSSAASAIDIDEGSSDEGDLKPVLEMEGAMEGGEPSPTPSSDGDTVPPSLLSYRSRSTSSCNNLRRASRLSVSARRQSLVVGSFGAGIGSLAALSDLQEASKTHNDIGLGRLRDRSTSLYTLPGSTTHTSHPPLARSLTDRERSGRMRERATSLSVGLTRAKEARRTCGGGSAPRIMEEERRQSEESLDAQLGDV